MKFIRILSILTLLLLIASCSTKKKVLYLQDFDNSVSYESGYLDYLIKVDDVLKIDISSENPEVTTSFKNNTMDNNNKDSMLYNGYLVNTNGYINFTNIGPLMVLGKTTDMVRDEIYKVVTENGILTNPTIDVKLLNTHFTILGEVVKPGKYTYLKNNMNILEAIGMAGDLTINGQRRNIRLIREVEGKKLISTIDLTKTDFLKTDYQIFSGDIIIVNPNTTRVKNAGIIGNSGTLLSLLSFILSSIIVINN